METAFALLLASVMVTLTIVLPMPTAAITGVLAGLVLGIFVLGDD